MAVVTDLPGGATDVEHVDDLDTEVRDLISGLTDVDPDDVEIKWHFDRDGNERS